MKLAINTIPLLSPLTGIGQYINQMVHRFNDLEPDLDYYYFYGIFTRNLLSGHKKDTLQRLKMNIIGLPIVSSMARGLKLMASGLRLRRFDTYFEPNFIPVNIRANKIVTTVHDFSFLLYPEHHPKDRIGYFKKNFFKRVQRSDIIITPSDYIKTQAEDILSFDSRRIVTIPHGYNCLFSAPSPLPRHGDRYILSVGSLEPRKNIPFLIKAYLNLPEVLRREFKLRLVGFHGWNNSEIIGLLEKHKQHIEYMGYVSDQDLATLYQNAACFVFPSLYEGFGLPPLEAMAAGCPVIASNIGSVTEVCGNAALYCDPKDEPSLCTALEQVLEDEKLQKTMIQKGLERSASFDWDQSARKHLRILNDA